MKFRSIGRAVINHQKTPERITAPVLSSGALTATTLRSHRRPIPSPNPKNHVHHVNHVENPPIPLAPLRGFAASREIPILNPTHPPKAKQAFAPKQKRPQPHPTQRAIGSRSSVHAPALWSAECSSARSDEPSSPTKKPPSGSLCPSVAFRPPHRPPASHTHPPKASQAPAPIHPQIMFIM